MDDQLRQAAVSLREAGVDSPLLDAQLMLAHVLRATRLELIAHPERELSPSEALDYSNMVARRAARTPLAYILSHREFYGVDFEVAPGVLVPRPETELLVEVCLKRVGSREVTIADLGVGSGAIAIALAASLPLAMVYATEISDAAIAVARTNVSRHCLDDRITILAGDMLEPLHGLGRVFDAIVSNPPYIPSSDIPSLEPEVAVHEPRQALDGGLDGLDAYRVIFPGAMGLLREGGFVAVEVGAGEAGDVAEIARSAGYGRIEVARDLAHIERVVVAYR